MAWTLKYEDVEKTFEAWGFNHLRRRSTNRKADVVTFVDEGVKFDETPQFPFDSEIEIFRDGVRWFAGRIKSTQRSGSIENESISYQAEGVLGWLNDLIFRQPWKYLADYSDPDSSLTTLYLSNLVLFQKIDGLTTTFANIKEQIEEIFQYISDKWIALGQEPRFQLDSSKIPEIQLPYMEVRNISCARALECCFGMTPDLAMWVDYETSPPTVHIAQRGITASVEAHPENYLQPVELEVPAEGDGDGSSIVNVSIQARDDIKVPCIAIDFLQLNSINGFTARYTSQDVYPPDVDVTGFRVIPQTVDLEGTNLSYPQAVLSVRPIEIESADWWKLVESTLAKPNVTNLTIREPSRSTDLQYEILPDSDPWAPWMQGSTAREDIVECYADYDLTESQNHTTVTTKRVRNQLVQVRIMATSKPSGSYTGPANGTLGEPVPVGMARAIYEAIAEPAYDGTVTLEEGECSGSVSIGNVINLNCARRPEWLTARMMVFEVEEDVDEGRTQITVGPAQRLDVSEILDWLRGFRSKNQGAWASRASGLNYSGGALRVATRAHKQSIVANKEAHERIVLLRPENASRTSAETATQTIQAQTAQIVLDILDCMGMELKVQEIKLCIDGTTWYCMGLFSDKYLTAKTTNPIGS